MATRLPQPMREAGCGVPRRVGPMSRVAQATTAAVAAPVAAARTDMHAQAVAHLEATRWRQGDKQVW